MSPGPGAEHISIGDLRQGDIVVVDPIGQGGTAVGLNGDAAARVAILSQTCDVVQPSKNYCLVAPVIEASGAEMSAARTGRKPLLVYLNDASGNGPWVADIGRAFSLGKSQLSAGKLIAHVGQSASGADARRLGARIGRAFSRYPFPDEVYPVFTKLQDRLRAKAGTAGNLGKVIDLVDEIRVSADQWEKAGRSLRLHVIVSGELLISEEDADPNWSWTRVSGMTSQDVPGNLTINRVCELLLANLRGDQTSLLHLWAEFGQALYRSLIEPCLNEEVVSVEVEAVSDIDFTYLDMRQSESLDLETLSDSTLT